MAVGVAADEPFHTRLPHSLRSPSTQPPSLARGAGGWARRAFVPEPAAGAVPLPGWRLSPFARSNPREPRPLRSPEAAGSCGSSARAPHGLRVQSAAHLDARKHARSGAYLERCFACRERVLGWDPEHRAWGDAQRARREGFGENAKLKLKLCAQMCDLSAGLLGRFDGSVLIARK